MPCDVSQTSIPVPGLLRVPGWDAYPWLRAGFSTRQGGASFAYGEAEQNLGWTADDDPAIVARNRQAFAEAVGPGQALSLVTVGQVHGAQIHDVSDSARSWMSPEGKATCEGDGLLSHTAGQLLAILTADCVPVLLADTRTHAIGAFHAGWRGTLARIVQRGIDEMRRKFGTSPADLVAAIGPCIRQCCFEVGADVQASFLREFAGSERLFSANDTGRVHLDLVEANRAQLVEAGVPEAEIRTVGECTACSRTAEGKRQYFSYRAEAGKTGRMLSGIAALK